MRIIKIIVLLSLIQIPFLFANYRKDKWYAAKLFEERIINRALKIAMFDATVAINEYSRIELIEGTPELVLDPKEVIETFLNSLTVQLVGVTVGEALPYIVPFIAIADVDGVYFYEMEEENSKLVPKYAEKEDYIRYYPGNVEIQYYLNDHIKVNINNKLIYDGLYQDQASVFPSGFDYEEEKIAAVVNKIEERMNQYYSSMYDKNRRITLPLLQEEDWDDACGDVTIYALVQNLGAKPIRVINNTGVREKR